MEKMSYRLLVADDEYWTREKLRTMIDWKQYGVTFMKPAENGEEALRRMEEEPADILITDINMPFVNGVDLVKTIMERHPDTVVFVVSGYDDFQYVRETLMAGAIDYLLKPVSKIDLVNAVSRALEIIGRRLADRERILKAASMIQDRELSMLVEKEPAPFPPALALEEGSETAGFSVMLIKIHEFQKYMEESGHDMNLLSWQIKDRIRRLAGAEKLMIFNYIFRSNEFIIITEWDAAQLRKTAFGILESFAADQKGPVTVAVSERSYTMESIRSAYVQSVSALMTRPFSRENKAVFSGEEEKRIRRKMENRVSEEAEMQVRSLLKSGNTKALKELILEGGIGLSHCMEKGWGYLEVRQSIKRICALLLDHCLREGRAEVIPELENLSELADKAVERLDIGAICGIVTEMADEAAAESRSEVGYGGARDIIKAAAEYIDRNYYEELTLASLSEKYNMESSYFSRLFKQETGKNLMLYIAEKRVEKAREYMEDENINLTEIAFLTGYDDYAYFSRVFKKIMGKSPREYRAARR